MTESIKNEWIEGVTPTWVECPHGTVIAEGTYRRPTIPTGDHPECWVAYQDGLEDEAQARADELMDEYNRDIREGL